MRTFAYCRVSTAEQNGKNQILTIRNAGYNIEDNRVISETVSGTSKAMARDKFKNLVEHKMEDGDRLVVLKLDRLGRDNIDIQTTVELLISKGIKIICLDLPISDLSSSEGKLMLQMFGAFAEFERNRIRERTMEGLNRARDGGVVLGRPIATSTTKDVQGCKDNGLSQSKTAKQLGISIATVKRHWNK